MSVLDFLGAAFSGAWSEKEFNDKVRSDIEKGFDVGSENLGRAHEEPVSNHLKEKTIYHGRVGDRNGGVTVFRNYAVIESDGKTWKAPILDPEGRLVQIGS